MPPVDTIKAITTNIEGILTGFGWKLEDLSADPDVDTMNFCRLDYNGEAFEDLFSERPEYNAAKFVIRVKLNRSAPGTSRDAQQEALHTIRAAIDVDALNIGGLASSKLVSRVRHIGGDVEYTPPISIIEYGLEITYREE